MPRQGFESRDKYRVSFPKMNTTGPGDVDCISQALNWVWLALLAWLVYLIVRPFLIPLGWAMVLGVMTYPVHARLAARWGPGARPP